jgi:hypothetical protein
MLRGLVARKFEQERWAKVEFSQAIDEQRIVLVGRVPNKWSKNPSYRLIESVRFHLSARCGRTRPVQPRSRYVSVAIRGLIDAEVGEPRACSAGPTD